MLKLLLSIKWVTLFIGFLFFAGAVLSFTPPVSWIAGFVFAPLAAMFFGIAYAGFTIQNKVESVAQTALEVANEHAGKVSDAVVERINNR